MFWCAAELGFPEDFSAIEVFYIIIMCLSSFLPLERGESSPCTAVSPQQLSLSASRYRQSFASTCRPPLPFIRPSLRNPSIPVACCPFSYRLGISSSLLSLLVGLHPSQSVSSGHSSSFYPPFLFLYFSGPSCSRKRDASVVVTLSVPLYQDHTDIPAVHALSELPLSTCLISFCKPRLPLPSSMHSLPLVSDEVLLPPSFAAIVLKCTKPYSYSISFPANLLPLVYRFFNSRLFSAVAIFLRTSFMLIFLASNSCHSSLSPARFKIIQQVHSSQCRITVPLQSLLYQLS